jgi:hypothetical protein
MMQLQIAFSARNSGLEGENAPSTDWEELCAELAKEISRDRRYVRHCSATTFPEKNRALPVYSGCDGRRKREASGITI